MKEFNNIAYQSFDDFLYGKSVYPVTLKNGLSIGSGKVLPEINFTLPTMSITENLMPDVINQYCEIIEGVLKRASELYVPGLIVEIELLPPTTYRPEWGVEITKAVREIMYNYEANKNLKSGLRITPVDIREDKNSEHMWKGKHWESILETFEKCAKEGADLLSIESIGGKDIHDNAIMFGEITKSLFALGILGVKDMYKLWTAIKDISDKTGSIPAGDTACGFANTAMVLAEKGYVSKVFASVVRVMSAVRSLAAYDVGAIGPHKDCGYEGIYIKAITGTPISMEGKSSACAHLSPVGNIAACTADLWSNESVQNIRLLGAMAPVVSIEQLAYDCRLMNIASKNGKNYALLIRDFLSESDKYLDPQAYVLSPDFAFRLSKEIVKGKNAFERIKIAANKTIEELKTAISENKIAVDERDANWLDIMQSQLDEIPDDENIFTEKMLSECQSEKFASEKYDL